MEKFRNILSKKLILVLLLIMSILISITIVYLLSNKTNEKKEEISETEEQTPTENEEPAELEENTEITKNWNIYINDKLGISFKHPKDWVVKGGEVETCNPYTIVIKTCIYISSPQLGSYLKIKLEFQDSFTGGGNVYENEYLSSKLIEVKNLPYTLMRVNKVNGIYDYFGKYNISLSFLEEIYESPQQDSFGDIIYADESAW